jgi:hypothetical protein
MKVIYLNASLFKERDMIMIRKEESKMLRKIGIAILALFGILWVLYSSTASSFVTMEGGRTYIVDQRGEKWDVTQAESIGFKPEGFQFGIGRNAFTPLDDSHLSDDTGSAPMNLRVIGVAEGSEAQAYSVPRLKWHEIANSNLGSEPIAVGY